MKPYLPQLGCSACDFECLVGWSHQIFGSFAHCRKCSAAVLIGSESSEMGPVDGESLRLSRFGESSREGWVSTATVLPPFTGTPGRSEPSDEEYRAFLASVLPAIACPACAAPGSIVAYPEEDDACPRCHTGKLAITGGILP